MAGASQVRAKRAATSTRVLDTTPRTTICCAGVAERGPVGATNTPPAVLFSFADYQKFFGGFSPNAQDLPLAVKAIFDEAGEGGGAQVVVSRVVHFTDPTDPATKTSAAAALNLSTANVVASAGVATSGNAEPFALQPNQHVDVKIDGGGASVATFLATAASRASGNGPFALSNGLTLTMAIDGVACPAKVFATSEFVAIGAATPAEVVASLNAHFAGNAIGALASVSGSAVLITSNRKGTGSIVNITGGTANAGILAFTTGTGGSGTGTGNVSNIAAVTAAEGAAVIGGAVAGCVVSANSGKVVITSNTLGGASSVQVVGASTALAFGFDNAIHSGLAAGVAVTLIANGKTDGTYANALSIKVSAPNSGKATDFNVALLKGGIVVEKWADANMDPTSPNYIATLINTGSGSQVASNLITITDQLIAVPSPNNVPTTGTFGPMTGGNDGLAGIADADFTGGVGSTGRTGLRVFDLVDRISIVGVPNRATSATVNALINYCETVREGLAYALIDPPANQNASQIVTFVSATALIQGLSEMASTYWPRVKVDNPNTAIFGAADTVTTAPFGPVAGLCARLDQSKEGGSFEHPASQEKGVLRTVRGLETTEVLDQAKRGFVFDALINPIMTGARVGAYVDGARTLKSSGPFPTVGESRGVLFVQQEIISAADPKRNQNIRPRLYNELKVSIETFLQRLTRAECFASKLDVDAWYFDIGSALNTPAVQKARDVEVRMGLATSAPAEFINFVIAPFSAPAAA